MAPERARLPPAVVTGDSLTSFLYELMRDHLPTGVVERLVDQAYPDITYSNGMLAAYARFLADRLRAGVPPPAAPEDTP